ncbi:hypothetical protein H9Q10_09240 [Eikenella sp. S3360]|uniref:Uncharacterized protein n=1 Tax=Eikenella glucosivorans TaxID=2766967 RepID=A0ABS0NC01_9NEIS|nr:hypothetical protein [Eikenella glucosivorans]MBH5329849.1 hypothetical protein [Eikenella glucosivorans]
MKSHIPTSLFIAAAAALFWAQSAAACSPNLPNYGNCIRQQQDAQRQQQIHGAQQQQPHHSRQQREQQATRPPRPLTAEESRILDIALNGDPNAPKGCNQAMPDGRLACWDYSSHTDTVSFHHVSPHTSAEHCARDPRRCSQHGLQYTYGKSGRLRQIQIYDRSIILKGENTYAFLPDGSVQVFDHKSNNDTANFNQTYTIPANEALRRLGLQRSILNLGRLTAQPRRLAAQAAQLPAGCTGTAESSSRSAMCNIELLWKNGR